MAYMGWAVQGHAAPWWKRSWESRGDNSQPVHSQNPHLQSVRLLPTVTNGRNVAQREHPHVYYMGPADANACMLE